MEREDIVSLETSERSVSRDILITKIVVFYKL